MFCFLKTFSGRLAPGAVLISLVVLAGSCITVPSTPAAAPQNAPPTPQFETTQVSPNLQVAPDMSPLAAPGACPGLDSALAQIVGSADPIAQARQLQLTVKDDKIQVVLNLKRPDASFLHGFDVEIGAQVDTRVQAFVAPDLLCDLLRSGEVLSIQLPSQGVPQ